MKYKALLFSLFATANLFAQHPAIHFEIETDQPCQTMDYFGASDCWSMQFIGLWPQEKQNQVADWLFSKTMKTDNLKESVCLYGVLM